MQIAGIVAEYNPFHNGHAYQISQTKKDTGCDLVIAVMSGNFSQRGSATIVDKFTRTKMALLNGVDLVLELPVPFATSSAEYFAKYAVSLLDQSQVVDFISFGSECGEIPLLKHVAQTLTNKSKVIDSLIKSYLKQGLSFPRARMQALIDHLLPQYPESMHTSLEKLLQSPNNILGIEYLKALDGLNSTIIPYSVKRTGANYHDTAITGPIASATAIRHSMALDPLQYKLCMPLSSYELLNGHQPPSMENLTSFLHFKLMFSQEEDLYSLWDIPKDLIRTLIKQAQAAPSYEVLVNHSTSKTYTRATVQRALLRILLDIHTTELEPLLLQSHLPYIRVLGCHQDALPLLSKLSQNATVPLITNLGKQYTTLSPLGQKLIDYEVRATKLYAYLTGQPEKALQDFTQPFIRMSSS